MPWENITVFGSVGISEGYKNYVIHLKDFTIYLQSSTFTYETLKASDNVLEVDKKWYRLRTGLRNPELRTGINRNVELRTGINRNIDYEFYCFVKHTTTYITITYSFYLHLSY